MKPSPERGVRRTLWLGVGVVAGLWAAIVVGWGPSPFTLTFDDAYYYFQIAQNLADGSGSTFDGINETNGYHPLWLGISTVPYLLGVDGLAAVRVLLLVQLAVWSGTLLLLTDLVARASVGWSRIPARRADAPTARRAVSGLVALVLVLLAGNPFLLKMFVNGLESGIAAFFAAGLLVLVFGSGGHLVEGTDTRWRLLFSGTLALAFLARTDGVLLAGCLGLWALVEARTLGRAAIRPLLELFALPAVTIGAYLALNQVLFGDPRQVSGEVKRLTLTGGRAVTLLAFAAVALLVAVRGYRRTRTPTRNIRFSRLSAFTARTAWFGAFCILLTGYYLVLSAQQWLWYFAPLGLYLLAVALFAVSDMAESAVVEAPVAKPAIRALSVLGLIFVVPLVAGGVLQARSFADPNLRSIQEANRDAGVWISDNLPPDAVLASWDAGVVGYFSDQSVVNIDGVVNSHEFLEAQRNGTVDEFLRDNEVAFLVNHAVSVDGEDPGIRADADRLFGEGTGDGVVLEESWPFLYSGQIEGRSANLGGTRQMAVFLHRLPAPSD